MVGVQMADEDVADERRWHLQGDRESIRSQTVILALQGIRERLRESG